jgi:flagellar L-ring protein FlgH
MRILLSCILPLLLTGCINAAIIKPGDPRYAPITPSSLMPAPPSEGSIYQANYGATLWEDQRARRVGDILTVVLQENTSSSKTLDSSVKKKDKNALGVTDVFGYKPPNGRLDANTENNRAFSGSSDADQKNSLSGRITVTVSEVLPNGVLVVRGEKWMTLSQGEEYIRIEGMVRPADILPDNTLLSTRIADARITYSGKGTLASAGSMGWLSRFFVSDWWPF